MSLLLDVCICLLQGVGQLSHQVGIRHLVLLVSAYLKVKDIFLYLILKVVI